MDNVNIRPMLDFVEDVVGPDEMSKLLDEVVFEYAYSNMEHGGGCNASQVNQNIYLLRTLRDVFKNMAVA